MSQYLEEKRYLLVHRRDFLPSHCFQVYKFIESDSLEYKCMQQEILT